MKISQNVSRSPVLGAIVAVVLSALVATPLAAELTPEDMQMLETHLERGRDHLDEGNFEAAIDDLEQARQLHDHPLISVNIAEAYRKLNRCSIAEAEYEALAARDDLEGEVRAEFEEGREKLDECVETVQLSIECVPEEATIELQGPDMEEQFDCPFVDEMEVGMVRVEVSKPGFQTEVLEIVLEAGEDSSVEVALDAEPEPEEEPLASDAGEEVGDESVPDEPLVAAGEPQWPTIASLAAIGVGTAMIAGGGLVDYGSRSRAEELAAARDAGDREYLETLESQGTNRRLTAGILYTGGLLFIAGGVTLQLIDFTPSESNSSNLSIWASPTGITTTISW